MSTRVLDVYLQMYNRNAEQIERLINIQESLRRDLMTIINLSYMGSGSTNNTTNTTNTNTAPRNNNNRTNNSNRNANTRTTDIINALFSSPGSPIHYDYNNPISQSTYRTPLATNTNTNNATYTLSNILRDFLNEPVIVRATDEQIAAASRTLRYGDISEPLSTVCPISLERFTEDQQVTQLRPCGHIFCTEGFQRWFQSNVRCPVCRYDIRNYNPVSNNTTEPTTQPVQQSQPTVTTQPIVTTQPTRNNVIVDMSDNEIEDSMARLTQGIFGSILGNSPVLSSSLRYDPERQTFTYSTIRPITRTQNDVSVSDVDDDDSVD
jgi:hypothetical protein